MQENDFEQTIRQQMDDFTLAPNDAVWQKVALRIAKEKKRRRLIFFWLFGVLMVGGGVAYWLLGDSPAILSKTVATTIESDTAHQPTKAILQQAKTEKPSTTSESADDHQLPTLVGSDTSASITQTNDRIIKGETKTTKALTPRVDHPGAANRRLTANHTATFVPESASQNAFENKILKQQLSTAMRGGDHINLNANDEFTASITFGDISTMPRDSVLITSIFNPFKRNDTASQAKVPDVSLTGISPKIKKKRMILGGSLSVGVSDNVNKLPLISAVNADANYSIPGNLNNGQQQPQPQAFNGRITYTNGLSLSAGMFTEFGINRRLSATAGIDYQYYSARSKVGTTTTVTQRLYDSVLRSSADVEKSYTSGNSATFTNRYHYLSVPLMLHWKLSGNKRSGTSLFAGLSPSVLMASTALYANTSRRIFYEESGQFNRFQLTAYGGFMFGISNIKRYQINVGPTVQYGLLNMAKRELNLQQHLFFFGIKTNIIFQQ